MAYDEQGNYYFNPQIDEDDADLYRDELKRQEVRKVVEAQQKHAAESNNFNTMWQETLKEEGIDQKAYAELYNEDPQAANKHMKTAMQHVARSVKAGKKQDRKQHQSGKSRGDRDARLGSDSRHR